MNKEKRESVIQAKNLELPKGGGAIRGIGESFSTNEFSGTNRLSLPIQASPCRSFEPELSVDYNSGSGNGVFGIGFSLSIPSIARRTNIGTPKYQGQDQFIISGSEYLVPLGNPRNQKLKSIEYLVQNYAPRKEGEFNLIEYWQYTKKPESSKSFWKVTTKDHVVSIFGFNPQAQIANPADTDQIFRWCLEESYDPKGNHHIFYYKQEDTIGVPSDAIYEQGRIVTANRYLDRLCYGNDQPIYDSIVLSENNYDNILWHFEHVLDYGQYDITSTNNNPYKPAGDWQYRSDAFSNYDAGFEIRTYRRCLNILLFHRFKELGDNPTLIHASTYNYDINEAGISVIKSVRETGYQWDSSAKIYNSASYPDLEFDYTKFNPSGHAFGKLTNEDGKDLVDISRAPEFSLVDLHGEGIPGILYTDGSTASYKRPDIGSALNDNSENHPFAIKYNQAPYLGNLAYNKAEYPRNFPIGYMVEGSALRLMDITGNSRLDLVYNNQSVLGYWESMPYEDWEGFKPLKTFPADFTSSPSQTFVDATGNGLNDILQIIGNNIIVYPAKGTNGFGSPIFTDKPAGFPAGLESTPQVAINFAGMDGSGKQHLVKITRDRVSYWPNLSYGRFGEEIVMANPPTLPLNFDTSRLFLVDTDGSGTSDIIYVSAKQIFLYLNCNGNSFNDPIIIDLPVNYNLTDHIIFADLFGRGNACMVISSYVENNLNPSHFYYDFCQKQKPYLLNNLTNNMGASTEITYGSSVDSYLADKKAGLPWITNIPFPVHVVTKITHKDEVSNSSYSSCYTYHHGHYDGADREFRGFGRVDRQDSEYFPPSLKDPKADPNYVAPSLSKTWYDTGCYEQREALLKQYKKEHYQGDKDAFNMPDNIVDPKVSPGDKANLKEAYRALAGAVIRSEIYGLDNDKNNINPYSVSESNYYVRLDQPKGNNNYAICFVHSQETISYSYERNPKDPQIHQSFILDVDAYGNVEKSCDIAYGRRAGEGKDIYPEQQIVKVTCSTGSYINHDLNKDTALDPDKYPADQYLLGVPLESKLYEIKGLDIHLGRACSFSEVQEYIKKVLDHQLQFGTSDNAILLGWNYMIYAKVDENTTAPLPEGEVMLPLLPYIQKTAEFTNNEIGKIFDTVLTQDELQAKLKEGYYQFDDNSNYWWSSGLKAEYLSANQFYLQKATLTPTSLSVIGEKEEIIYSSTTYTYDSYNMLLVGVEDALGNKTEAKDIDYQTMHPDKMIDMNGRVSQVSFDPLGHVIYTTMYGYEDGKQKGFAELIMPIMEPLEPSNPQDKLSDIITNPANYLGKMQSYFYYDVFAWKNRQEPVRALSLLADDYPDQALGLPGIKMSIVYNDGFGRNLVTKLKVEAGESFLYDPATKKITTGSTDKRWLASGRVQYNNKGKPVKEYEPYYIDTPDYISNPIIDEFGVSPTVYYDPLERVTHAITAKGFLTKTEWSPWESASYDANNTIVESPYFWDNIATLNPDKNVPYYDKDLTAEGRENIKYAMKYFNTKTTTIVDNLGNNILTRQIKKYPEDLSESLDLDNPNTNVKEEVLITKATYDILGRVINNVDPRFTEYNKNNPNSKQLYNFEMFYVMGGKTPLKTISVDSGISWTLSNILGNPIYALNGRKVSITHKYDELNRPISTHVKKTASDDPDKDPLVLDQITQRIVYGDTPGANAPINCNLKGQVYHLYDEAGLVTTSSYCLTGGAIKTERRFLKDYTSEVNWSNINPLDPITAAALLQDENEKYTAQVHYDALGRIKEEIDADKNKISPNYYESGLLKSITALTSNNGKITDYVKEIKYNAKGQRLHVTYGNGVKTTYNYDPKTFANVNIQSINGQGSSKPIQNLNYQYDPAGNIFQKDDLAVGTVYYNNQEVASQGKYLYDSLYQLIQGTGVEKIGNGKVIKDKDDPYAAFIPNRNNNEAIHNYIERYSYDKGGNLYLTNHISEQNNWTRSMVVSYKSNRAVISDINNNGSPPSQEQVDNYFDNSGNQIQMRVINPLSWDYRNQLSKITTVKRNNDNNEIVSGSYNNGNSNNNNNGNNKSKSENGSNNSAACDSDNDDKEYYIYDASGSRVRKIAHQYNIQSGRVAIKETIYLGGLEIRKTGQGVTPISPVWNEERHSLYLTDSGSKVAQCDYWLKGNPPENIKSPYITYNLNDNLGSYTLQIDQSGNIISREEYSPYGGTTLFIGSGSADQLKAYRYSGKEKDATGFYYYGARYYAPWLARWLSTDPAGTIDGLNIYTFVTGNPISYVDIMGMAKNIEQKIHKLKTSSVHSPDSIPEHNITTRDGISKGRKLINKRKAFYGILNNEKRVFITRHHNKKGKPANVYVKPVNKYGAGNSTKYKEIISFFKNKELVKITNRTIKANLYKAHTNPTQLISDRKDKLFQDQQRAILFGTLANFTEWARGPEAPYVALTVLGQIKHFPPEKYTDAYHNKALAALIYSEPDNGPMAIRAFSQQIKLYQDTKKPQKKANIKSYIKMRYQHFFNFVKQYLDDIMKHLKDRDILDKYLIYRSYLMDKHEIL